MRKETGQKRVRIYLGGEVVADTTAPVLVWEKPYYPTYYFPAADVRRDLLVPDGDGGTFTVKAGGKEAPGAARQEDEVVRFDWDAMDAWFEEDEEVFTHPRDPHSRVDILASSRHVRVEVDGETVAESTSPRLLFETGLPVRYYLPQPHVRMGLLEPTNTVTHCPYKGQAQYWSVRTASGVHTDLAWSYRAPLPESQKIAGLVAFYDDKVDLYVDGVKQ
ncbi:MAG: DUF427 domain-containing protein [Acidimicrobiales bacterium]